MKRSSLRRILVGLCAAAVVGLLVSSASAATSHKQARSGQREVASCPVSPVGDVCPATWMHDLAPYIANHKLTDIVIPGSHDSATYGLPNPDDDLWHTQNEDFIHQLNDGMREFDIRVEWIPAADRNGHHADYYAHHGSGKTDGFSNWLTLGRILSDIADWATEPGHGQEILMLNVAINDQDTNPAIWQNACRMFGDTVKAGLVAPIDIQNYFGTTDPGQVKLSQLWSLPDPNGAARVIMDGSPCSDYAWGPNSRHWDPAITGGLFGGYYADQCTADGKNPPADQQDGVKKLLFEAVKTRALVGDGQEPSPVGPAKVGGLYVLSIAGTPEGDCLVTPRSMLGDEREVLAALYQRWQTDSATKANLNVVSGDFVQETDLIKDVVAMDETFPKLSPSDRNPTTVPAGWHTGFVGGTNYYDRGFAVQAVNAAGSPVPGLPVKFDATSAGGTFPDGARTVTVKTDASGWAVSPALQAGTRSGRFSISVTAPGASSLSLPLTITASCPHDFVATSGNHQTVKAGHDFLPLVGHWVDEYGNVVTDFSMSSPCVLVLNLGQRLTFALSTNTNATWSGGKRTIYVSPAADGTITLPTLNAGSIALQGPDLDHTLVVYIGYSKNHPLEHLGIGWELYVTGVAPTAPTITNLGNGDGQVTELLRGDCRHLGHHLLRGQRAQ